MNCTVCDTPLTPGATFCPNCGTRVTAQTSAGSPTIAMPAAADERASAAAPQQYGPGVYSLPQSYSRPDDQSNAPQPYAPPQPYMPPQPSYMPASPPTSGAATVSLIFGILSWVALPLIGAIVAVIAGHMARNEIRASNNQLGGGGMATAGLILGYLQIGLSLLGCIFFVLLFAVGAFASLG